MFPPSTTAQCHKNRYGNGVCLGGTPLFPHEQCNGQCYNQYSQEANSSSLGLRSYYRCDNGQCVLTMNMCQGFALCEDKSDIRACNPKLKCTNAGGGSNVVTINSELVSGHSFCLYDNTRNDKIYQSITREDEEDNKYTFGYNVIGSSLQSDKLKHCNASSGASNASNGIMCGKICIGNFLWCRMLRKNTCEDGDISFSTWDLGFCQNSTFWSNISCTTYYDNGAVAACCTRAQMLWNSPALHLPLVCHQQ